MVSWTSTGKLLIKALGPIWAIPTTSRALVEDARSCPEAGTAGPAWSESPKRADIGGELAPENQVWEGQNGAMRRRRALLTFTLHRTAGFSFIGGNAYRLTFGHGWNVNVNCPQRKELVLGPKEKTASKPVQGARPWTSLTVYVGHYRHIVRSDYDMLLPENGEKIYQSQEDSPEFQAVYVRGKELSCPFPARRFAFVDRAPACHWCVRRGWYSGV